jgi:hypothetical protein
VDRLSTQLGPRHPQLQALQSQLSGARGLIDTEIRRIASSTQTELKRAVQLEQELSSRLAQLKVRQGDLSNEMVTLRELERGVTAQRSVPEAYLLRARETGEQQGINAANISVISKAYPPLEALPPSRSTIAMAGLVFGLLAGVGIGGVRGTMDGLRQTMRGRRPALSWRGNATASMFGGEDRARSPGDTGPAADRVEPRGSGSQSGASPDINRFASAEPVQPRDRTDYEYPAIQPAPPTAARQRPVQAEPYATPADLRPSAGVVPAGHAPYAPPTHYPPHYGYAQPEPLPAAASPSGSAGHWTQPSFREPASHAYRAPEPGPGNGYPYEYPPVHQPRPASAERPHVEHSSRKVSAEEQLSIEEIQSNLRELRDAIRELTETRTRRRYF